MKNKQLWKRGLALGLAAAMTFTMAPCFAAASTTALISSKTACLRPSFSRPYSMTISISSAPFSQEFSVSKTFAAVDMAPSGKPMTAQVFTSVPFSCLATKETHMGLTQTEANSYCFASSQIRSISLFPASGRSRVWSMYFSRLIHISPLTCVFILAGFIPCLLEFNNPVIFSTLLFNRDFHLQANTVLGVNVDYTLSIFLSLYYALF